MVTRILTIFLLIVVAIFCFVPFAYGVIVIGLLAGATAIAMISNA